MTYHSLSMVWGCLGGTGHPHIIYFVAVKIRLVLTSELR